MTLKPSEDWQPVKSMPRDGSWFFAETEYGQRRYARYADKDDRLPISDDGAMWSTLPVRWCLAKEEGQ